MASASRCVRRCSAAPVHPSQPRATGVRQNAAASVARSAPRVPLPEKAMSTITTKDGVTIYYKDWGRGQPIVFSHGRPLSADDWDAQLLLFVSNGSRVI